MTDQSLQTLRLKFADMENQRNAALAQIDDLKVELGEMEKQQVRQHSYVCGREMQLHNTEEELEKLKDELAKLARPEEPEEAAHEWKSPQGIWFCRDNADIYGGGRGALWYLDEDKDEWMLTCWVGEDKLMKQALWVLSSLVTKKGSSRSLKCNSN